YGVPEEPPPVPDTCGHVAEERVTQAFAELTTKLSELQENVTNTFHGCNHCPNGWVTSENKCFHVPLEKASWMVAHGVCARLDSRARLASIDAADQAVVEPLSSEKMWIGLSYDSANDAAVWADDSHSSHRNWYATQPDDESELCVLIKEDQYRQWHDYNCNDRYNFVCEIVLH
uniref:Lectin BRA-2 n=1 Tax=Megabalanus rosa TaxID=6680 RepID=LEC2_MEGRO|nr:RecName: Full=Lectin BRA-2 [Megabalanus rosa]